MKMSKRILSVFLALVMMVAMFAVSVSASRANYPDYDSSKANLTIGTAKCTAAEEVVTVPVSIGNNPGFWGMNFQLSYPSQLTFDSIEKVNANFTSCMASATNNVLTILLEASSEENNIVDNGVLFNIKFKVNTFSLGSSYAVDFADGDRLSISNASGASLLALFTYKAGAVECVDASSTPTNPSHSHSFVLKVTKKATYFATGEKTYVCACGETNGTVTVAKKKLAKPTITVKGLKKSVKITWKRVTGATGYVVEMKSGKKYKVVKTITKGKTVSYTQKKLKKGTKYTFRVKAMVKSGSKKVYSKYSTVKSAKAK